MPWHLRLRLWLPWITLVTTVLLVIAAGRIGVLMISLLGGYTVWAGML